MRASNLAANRYAYDLFLRLYLVELFVKFHCKFQNYFVLSEMFGQIIIREQKTIASPGCGILAMDTCGHNWALEHRGQPPGTRTWKLHLWYQSTTDGKKISEHCAWY
jgi:hypothetical protein